VESWVSEKWKNLGSQPFWQKTLFFVEKYSMCVFFENSRAWNRMQEMEMVQRPYMIFIAMGIRVGSTYIVEIIKLMFKTTAASIWPLSQYG